MKATVVCLLLGCVSLACAQESSSGPSGNVGVQRLIKFSGSLTDTRGAASRVGTVRLRFAVYDEPDGGKAHWEETQSVRPDAQRRYTVLLGDATPGGLPRDIYVSRETLWLGVKVSGQPEQPRIRLAELPSAAAPDPVAAGGPMREGAVTTQQDRYLALMVILMFVLGTWLAWVEVAKWWKRRLQQLEPPPLASIMNYTLGPDRRWRATVELRFPFADEFRSIGRRFQHSMKKMKASLEERQKNALTRDPGNPFQDSRR